MNGDHQDGETRLGPVRPELAVTDAADRFDRQRLIPGWDQPAVERARFLVAGAGALGNEVAKHLAMLGARHLVAVDLDVVEESNLNRTTFFFAGDVGAAKVEALKRQVEARYPHCRVQAHPVALQELAEAELASCDLFFGCVDNHEARLLLNSHAVYYRRPYVDGATDGFLGQVRTVVPPYTSCAECHLPPGAYRDIGERFSCTRERLEALGLPVRHVPAVSTTTSIVAAAAVDEALKVLFGLGHLRADGAWPAGIGTPLPGVLHYDARTNRHQVVAVAKHPRCHICGVDGVRVGEDQTLRLRAPTRLTLKGLYPAVARKARLQDGFLLLHGLSPLPDDAELTRRVEGLEVKARLLAGAAARPRKGGIGSSGADEWARLRRLRRLASRMPGPGGRRLLEQALALTAWARGGLPLAEYGVGPGAVLTVVRPSTGPEQDFNVFLE